MEIIQKTVLIGGVVGLILATVIAGNYMNTDLPLIFIFNGVVFLIIGLIMLIQFVRKYPLIDGGAVNAAE